MGDIGDPIDTTIPDVGAFGTEYAQDINDILEEVVARLTAPVPVSSIENDDQGTFDMNNGAFTNAQYVSFYEQDTQPSGAPSGRIVYFSGNIWFVTASGAIQVTDGTGLNVTLNGGIGGDYGGSNPALVSFVDASETYEFYDDQSAGEWAIIKARQLTLVDEASGLVTRVIPSPFTGGNWTLTLPTNPATAGKRAILTIDDAGNLDRAGAGTISENFLVTGTAAFSGVATFSVNPVLSGSTKINHGSRYVTYQPAGNYWVSVGTAAVGGTGYVQATASPTAIDLTPQVQRTWRIKAVKAYTHRVNTAGTTTVTVTTTDWTGATGSTVTTDNATSTTVNAEVIVTVTLGTPHAMAAGETLHISVSLPNSGDRLKMLEVEYDSV